MWVKCLVGCDWCLSSMIVCFICGWLNGKCVIGGRCVSVVLGSVMIVVLSLCVIMCVIVFVLFSIIFLCICMLMWCSLVVIIWLVYVCVLK